LKLDQYRDAISEAKKAVEKEEEPFKSIAFRVILEKLLHSEEAPDSVGIKEKLGTKKRKQERRRIVDDEILEDEQGEITFDVPKELFPEIMKLDDREKIPVFWYYSSRKSMTVSEFLMAASKKGFNFAPSYLPSKGGNFANRLAKEDGVLARDGKQRRPQKFKLTDVGILKVQKIIAGFSKLENKSK
jgi:hypothetical protein